MRVLFKQWIGVTALMAMAACSRSGDGAPGDSTVAGLPPGHVPITPQRGSPALLPVAQALVDSGNAAFRAEKFDAALDFYHKASEEQPDHPAPWFGTYMVGQAMKNTALADSALRMVRARAPEMQAHPQGPATLPAPESPYSPHGSPKAPQGAPS